MSEKNTAIIPVGKLLEKVFERKRWLERSICRNISNVVV